MATVTQELIDAVKMAKRVKTNAYDAQIELLLNAAFLDLGVAGVEVPETLDALVTQATITYVLMHFGEPDNQNRLRRSYDEQKAQLSTCTGYTDWLVNHESS